MEWTLYIKHKGKNVKMPAVVEYKSKQIIRIRVTGNKSMLLECDYPAIRFANGKKGVQWKVREGMKLLPSAEIATQLFYQLEELLKRDFKQIYPDELI